LEYIRKVVESAKVPVFVPKSGKQIETDESAKKPEVNKSTEEEQIEDLLNNLSTYFAANSKPFKMKAIDFEKDDDTNFHIDFIAATSNLRARMYAIPEVERLKTKAIAGRIMPAIATTTAAVSGLVTLELMKIVKGCELEAFKNLFMNLALPFWAFSEPGPAERKNLTKQISYTLWDSWDVKEGDLTLGELITHFEKKFNLQIGGVFNGAIMVFTPIFPAHMKRKVEKMSVLLKRKPGVKYMDLILIFVDNTTGEDISGPPVRFFFEK